MTVLVFPRLFNIRDKPKVEPSASPSGFICGINTNVWFCNITFLSLSMFSNCMRNNFVAKLTKSSFCFEMLTRKYNLVVLLKLINLKSYGE